MPRKLSKSSKLKSEIDEAGWYTTPEGRRQTEREFARALRAGKLSQSPGLKIARTDPGILAQLMEQAKESATKAISLRVSVADLERAKKIAEKAGLGYQTVLKQAIHEGLRKAG